MQFLLLLIVNIFMGAILYLIISLKLEKSANEFREKKLRKEMDEIIKEFNATADRNITILENRISTMKRLLQNSGDLQSIDVSIDDGYGDEGKEQSIKGEEKVLLRNKPVIGVTDNLPELEKEKKSERNKETSLFTGKMLSQLRNKVNFVIDKFGSTNASENDYYAELNEDLDPLIRDNIRNEALEEKTASEEVPAVFHDIEMNNHTASGPVSISKELSEDDIRAILDNSSDKYSAISELYEKGFSVEAISQYSGIPAGEVKLVLNLHGSGM